MDLSTFPQKQTLRVASEETVCSCAHRHTPWPLGAVKMPTWAKSPIEGLWILDQDTVTHIAPASSEELLLWLNKDLSLIHSKILQESITRQEHGRSQSLGSGSQCYQTQHSFYNILKSLLNSESENKMDSQCFSGKISV